MAERMKSVEGALSGAKGLPECTNLGKGYIAMTEVDIMRFVAGNDEFVHSNRAGVPVVCKASVSSSTVHNALNPFNEAKHRAADAQTLLKAKGYAVVMTDSVTPPTKDGSGKSAGRVVLVNAEGKALCKLDWSAQNRDKVAAYVSKTDAKLGIGPSDSAMQKLWESQLDTETCAAQKEMLRRAGVVARGSGGE